MRYSTSSLRLGLILIALLIAASTCVAGGQANLLLNGGAEQGKNELPSFWYEAAVAADGLTMYRDDDQVHSGKFSFAISNTHEYEQRVCNNWAQNITDVPAGKIVRLSAYVKTKDADSVNVCLQCWGVENDMLAFASTPVVRGDQDWVLMHSQPIVVPPETAYVCVRAVLTGLGAAWFDDISVTVVDMPAEVLTDDSVKPEHIHIPDDELTESVKGEIVKILPVKKDCMILAYMPEWSHGRVDNIAVTNNDGGVRTLLSWFDISSDHANDPNYVFLIALYSRKTTSNPPASKIAAYEILEDWPEITSWETQPPVAQDAFAQFDLVPGKGWKLFDITALVHGHLNSRKKPHGLMLRFAQENKSCDEADWSGYAFVSREGLGQWLSRRPKLLIVGEQK